MAQHAEPMDVDDENAFDNKENTYHHTNMLPRTPCTEKGYEELDVSELNMKLRYSITPSASPMSKSMSHCLDHKHNMSTDDSLNNTIIDDYENNLTRSLNSTLNKTELKTPKILPLQALPTEGIDNSRSNSVLRPLDSTVNANDITIAVSNETEIDNLSLPSSSSSMAHTPDATTPTKEMPKNENGSPIMRGLKSVLSIFRSSQSPIPPGDVETKTEDADLSPKLLPESKQAVASTPKNENYKERSLSRRSSPLKESIVFNEDLEKELQWNDDSTIVFSTEKIPIHKLFFQDKSSKSVAVHENIKQDDSHNSTVEFMDVSYNNLSIRDRTLNGTIDKSKVNELAESDGEFVDCETTFTQNESHSVTEEITAEKPNNVKKAIPENESVNSSALVNDSCKFDSTKDIINSIDTSHTVVAEGKLGIHLDYSTTDIVNQLSDLINETAETNKTFNNVDNVILANIETSNLSDFNSVNIVHNIMTQNKEIGPINAENNDSMAPAEQVSSQNPNLTVAGIDANDNIDSGDPKTISTPVENVVVQEPEVSSINVEKEESETKVSETICHSVAGYPSPVDIPLPNEDNANEINDNLLEDVLYNAEPVASISQNELMAIPNKTINKVNNDIQHTQVALHDEVVTCPPHLLSSDVPLQNVNENNSVNTDNVPHEAMAVVVSPVQSLLNKQPDIIPTDNVQSDVDSNIKMDPIIDVDNSSNERTDNVTCVEEESKFAANKIPYQQNATPSDIPLPSTEDLVETKILLKETATVITDSVSLNTNEKSDVTSIEHNDSEVKTINNDGIIETVENVSVDTKITDNEAKYINSTDPINKEHVEISCIETSNDKFHENVSMDVSMVDVNVKMEIPPNQSKPSQEETLSLNAVSVSHNLADTLHAAATDISKNVIFLNEASSSPHIKTDINVDEITNNNITLELKPEPITTTDKNFAITGMSNSINLLHENTFVSSDMKICRSADPLSNPNKSDAVSSSVFEMPQSTLSEKDTYVVKARDEAKSADIKLNDVPDAANSNKTATTDELGTPPFCEQGIDVLHEPEKILEMNMSQDMECTDFIDNAGLNSKTDSTSEYVEKADEEIILSESNSPFISMSAEEYFEPKTKKEEFEEIQNASSTESKVSQSAPISPKIVSKGYNLNFDDIDSINPFATKTKIRMSPPPDASPNKSLDGHVNETEIMEPLKTDKNINRRKSMPERKKPLKAKRHLNSTFDSTESSSTRTTPCKNSDSNIEPKTKSKQVQPPVNESEIKKTDVDITTKKLDQQTVEKNTREEPQVAPKVDDFKDEITVKMEHNTALNNETKVIENSVSSDSCKSPVKTETSSSEQSTYFSADASSTEQTELKNVFNLPELDSFNPFATKSKITSSPETSIVVMQNDPNGTLVIDSGRKEEDLSNCSESSKTSDEKDVTVHEVNTEDEDTLEGPFLEAEDDKDGDNMSEFNTEKVNVDDLNRINTPENEEAAEMFIDAEAFEFLMNQNKADEVAYSGKESLFLKFDPLFARRVTSEGVAAALNDIKKKQSTPKKTSKQIPPKDVDFLSFDKAVAGPSDLNSTQDVQHVVGEKTDDVHISASKPMMAVTPAVNPVVTPRKSLTPNKSNRLSMTFTSPAMAVIDRLLSLSGNSPSAGHDTTVTHVDRPHNDADQALTQLRELLAEKEINVYNLRCESKELKDRLSTLESQMKALEVESAERLKKVNELNDNLLEKTKQNRNMAAVVEEYERTIASLISETEQDKKRFAEERNQLIRDRDEQTAHLASMEVSFNDLHSKYEKSKQVIMGYKANEDAYKKSIEEFEDSLTKMHTNYESLKQHATSKLNHANQELEKINKSHEAEVLKFNAMIKRKELHITSLEESLAQKTKANEELTAICDELINKVG